jgi:acyl-CoA reductase-like NAD-dependent aldehyde dehydrogenase
MEDADLDKAAELAVTGATKNSGQRCTAVKRILVVEKVADEFSSSCWRRPGSSKPAIRWTLRPTSAP